MAPAAKPRDARYPELNAARQALRARRQRQIGPWRPWNTDEAAHSVERLRAWRHIVRLAEAHALDLEQVGRYLSRPQEWDLLQRRFLASPPQTYAVIGRARRCTIEAVNHLELQALFRLLTRLLAYDAAVRGEPDGLSGGMFIRQSD